MTCIDGYIQITEIRIINKKSTVKNVQSFLELRRWKKNWKYTLVLITGIGHYSGACIVPIVHSQYVNVKKM